MKIPHRASFAPPKIPDPGRIPDDVRTNTPPDHPTTPSGATSRAALWFHIFGDQDGLIAAFSGKRRPGEQALQDETSRYFEWPGQALQASAWLDAESSRGRDAYVCAHLINKPTNEEKARGIKPRRIKANAAPMLALYVDGDGASVPNTLPRPSAIVRSSPGREQAYWRLTRAIDPARGEQLNKRLAYAMGADKSGWDLTQLLRAPGCRNYKYEDGPRVEVISIHDRAYDPDELDRTLPPLPREQTKERPTVKIEPKAGPIGDHDRRALERMRASKRGAEIVMLEAGGSKFSKPDGSPDGNRDDLSMLSGYAFWLDKDPARMARAAEQTARVRPKWYERHYASGETYLEHSIAEAIAGCSQSFRELNGYDAGDDPPQIQPSASEPSTAGSTGEPRTLNEALAEIKRLRRALLDRDDRIELLTGIIEDQQQVIAATRAERDQLVDLRARDRRVALAEQRLDRVSQFSVGQKQAIKAVAQIGPTLINSLGIDDPILTGEAVAAVYGARPDTANDHLKVVDIPGSPVTRTLKPYGTKSLYRYQFATHDPAELIEQFAALGERLEKRPTTGKTPRCRTCPEGTGAILSLVCEGCGGLLDERHIKARKPGVSDNGGKNAALCPPPPSGVIEQVTYDGERRHVGDASELDPDVRAARMVATDTGRAVDPWKRVETRALVDSERGREEHRQAQELPSWLSEWPEHDQERCPPPRCVRRGCSAPCAPGDDLLCGPHRAEAETPAAVAGGSE